MVLLSTATCPVWGSDTAASSSPPVTVHLFYHDYSSGCEIVPNYGFDLHLLNDFENLFMVIFISSLENFLCNSCVSFLVELFLVSIFFLSLSVYIFSTQVSHQRHVICKHFFPILWVAFSLDDVVYSNKPFHFVVVKFVSFASCASRIIAKKQFPNPMIPIWPFLSSVLQCYHYNFTYCIFMYYKPNMLLQYFKSFK
jgi:hypothetical protein